MSAVNERELFDLLKAQDALKRIRLSMDGALGHPVWWLTHRLSDQTKVVEQCVSFSQDLWNDTRGRHKRQAVSALRAAKAKASQALPFVLSTRSLGGVYGYPFVVQGKIIAVLLLTGLKTPVNEAPLRLLSEYLGMLMETVSKSEELTRLSATIRPRAIALSTVHTVHRIINSTLNLEELVSRLAHLTAQVLRVHRCTIYLLDKGLKGQKRPSLSCKARVGFPKSSSCVNRIPLGSKLEGRVARDADIQLRKKVLCIPLIDEDVIGVVTITGKKDKKDFNHFDLEILTTLAEEAVIAIKNAQLYEEQRRVTLGTIQSLALVLGSRVPQNAVLPPETFARVAIRTAQELKLSEEQIQALHYAALLKETTKIGIPDEILKKPTKLTGEELSTLRSHPIQGAKIVQNFESLRTVAPIILYSREKYDGTGYPEGLKGEAIPIGARILSVINAFEAIVVGRPYRGQSSRAEAIQELERNSGTQFDPNVVEAFVRVIKKENLPQRSPHAGPQ